MTRATDWALDRLVDIHLDTWEDLGAVALIVVLCAVIFGVVTYVAGPLLGLAFVAIALIGGTVGGYLGLFLAGRL